MDSDPDSGYSEQEERDRVVSAASQKRVEELWREILFGPSVAVPEALGRLICFQNRRGGVYISDAFIQKLWDEITQRGKANYVGLKVLRAFSETSPIPDVAGSVPRQH